MVDSPTLSPQLTHEVEDLATRAIDSHPTAFVPEILYDADRYHYETPSDWERELDALCETTPRQHVTNQFIRELRQQDAQICHQPECTPVEGIELD